MATLDGLPYLSKDQAESRLTHIFAKDEFPSILLLSPKICWVAPWGYYIL
ncbi:hypothetical protein [Egbenema bharatensis]